MDDIFSRLPEWWPAVIFAVAAIYVIAKKKKDKKGERGNVVNGGGVRTALGGKHKSWCYIDDIGTEPNGGHDYLVALGLMKGKYGKPAFVGATYGKPGRISAGRHMPKIWMMDFTHAAGMRLPVLGGAARLGPHQGDNELSAHIAKEAHKHGDLAVCVGGKWTDVAIAVRNHPKIAKKITVYGIGNGNIGNDPESFAVLKRAGVTCRGWDVKNPKKDVETLQWIRKLGNNFGDSWMNKHVKPTKPGAKLFGEGGKHLREAARLNAGQARVGSSFRIADSATIVMAHEGVKKASDLKYVLKIAEKGLAKLPRA